MAKYLFVYHGGKPPETEVESLKVMDAWKTWLGSMGKAVIDGGNPVGPSTTIYAEKIEDNGGANPVSGYSLIEASNLDDAIAKGRQCPILADGGSIEVAEAFEM